jgi:hypothetical protein
MENKSNEQQDENSGGDYIYKQYETIESIIGEDVYIDGPSTDPVKNMQCIDERIKNTRFPNPRRNSLLMVKKTEDHDSLIYALHLTRIYITKGLNSKRLIKNQQKQRQQVKELMISTGIPLDGCTDYTGVVNIPKIVDFWNDKYAYKNLIFKVFVFGAWGHYKPECTYGPNNFNTPISIYRFRHHFVGIKNTGEMFEDGYKYCFSCQYPYERTKDIRIHEYRRPICYKCGNIDRPYPFQDYLKICTQCTTYFRNPNVYKQHLMDGKCRFCLE